MKEWKVAASSYFLYFPPYTYLPVTTHSVQYLTIRVFFSYLNISLMSSEKFHLSFDTFFKLRTSYLLKEKVKFFT